MSFPVAKCGMHRVVKRAIARSVIRLIPVFLAVLFLAVLARWAHAGTGMPLMKGFKSPAELATLVEASLKADSTGSRVLDPARCKRSGSCATAQDYFNGIRAAHPSARLEEIAELPRYLRSLVKKLTPAGEWQMSRLLVKGETHRYDGTGWHRAFFKGEEVWFDVNTGEPILAGECGNVVGKLLVSPPARVAAKEQCVTLEYDVIPGDEVRFAVLARKRLPASACWELCDGAECSAPPSPCDNTCDWIGPKSVVPAGFEPLHTGRYTAHAKHQVLRFPREVTSNYVALCDERAGLGESDADVVTPQDWQGRSVHHVPESWPLWGTTGAGSYQLPGR